MTSSLMAWAIRNRVSQQAFFELRVIFALDGDGTMPLGAEGKSEAAVQAVVRLEAARKGIKLWRNNVGVLKDARGVPVRYGLANDSKALNTQVKSADLIGWRPRVVQYEDVGRTIAQFVSRECKEVGWCYKGDEHEQAQLKWAEAIVRDGGDAKFCTGEGSL